MTTFDSTSIAAPIPICTRETLLARNSTPFKPRGPYEAGDIRVLSGHLHPNFAAGVTYFLLRMSAREAVWTSQRQHGRYAPRAYYRAMQRYYIPAAISWDTAQIRELDRYTTREQALAHLRRVVRYGEATIRRVE